MRRLTLLSLILLPQFAWAQPHRGAPPPHRQAQNVSVRIEPAKQTFLPGEHIPARIYVVNGNAFPITMYEMRKAFMSLTATGLDGGGTRVCRTEADLPTHIRQDRFVGLPAHGSMDKSFWMDGFCGELPAGRWRLDLTYTIPVAFDGADFGYDGVTGSFRESVEIAVGYGASARTNLALHVTRPRRTRADEPLFLDVVLKNYGPDAVYALRPVPPSLDLDVRYNGQPVRCTQPPRRSYQRADFVWLEANQELTERIALHELCPVNGPGDYVVYALYQTDERALSALATGERSRTFGGSLNSNALPFTRESLAPRANVTFEAVAPSQPFAPGSPIALSVRVRNFGPDTVGLANPTAANVSIQVTDDRGRSFQCGLAPAPGPTDLRPVFPGQTLAGFVELGPRCANLAPGRYNVGLTYAMQGGPQLIRAGFRQVPVWSGQLQSHPVAITMTAGYVAPAVPRRLPPGVRPWTTPQRRSTAGPPCGPRPRPRPARGRPSP